MFYCSEMLFGRASYNRFIAKSKRKPKKDIGISVVVIINKRFRCKRNKLQICLCMVIEKRKENECKGDEII